jgi:hypothetical protein
MFTFRIECQGEDGETIAVVPVEMRGLSFRGSLSEGDVVQIAREWRLGDTLEPREIDNLTTGGRFRAKGLRRNQQLVGFLVFLAFVTGMVIAVWRFH